MIVLLSGFGAALRAHERHAPETMPRLQVKQRLELAAQGSLAVDLRWAGRHSVFVLRYRDGITEHRLAQGLPPLRSVLPGGHQKEKVQGQTSMAVVGDRIASASVAGQFLWTKIPSSGSTTSAQIRRYDVSVSDFDFAGDEILLLGYAGYGDKMGGTFLWSGSLESSEEPHSSPGLEGTGSPAEVERRGTYMGFHAGSLRVLPNGDRLVYPGYDQEVRLVASSGKVKSRWDLGAFGVASAEKLAGVMTRDQKWFHGKATVLVDAWLAASSIVDDVLFVGKTPAVILRQRIDAGSRWLLVLLDADGPRSFTIPVGAAPGDARLRADGNANGEIALLVSRRQSNAGTGASAALERQDVLVVAIPD